MLNHNQSLEKIKQRSVTQYENLTAAINSKLVNQTTKTLKLGKKNLKALNVLEEFKLDTSELLKIIPEVIKVEEETTAKMVELRLFKEEQFARLWSGDVPYKQKLAEIKSLEQKKRDKKAQSKAKN